MDNYIIYRYGSPTGKSYIGQTCQTMGARSGARGQQYGASTKFYNAIQKYGGDGFKNHNEILEKNLNQEQANKLETYYIKKFDSVENGYNIQSGGHFNPAEICSKKIIGINCETKEIVYFNSITEAAKTLKVDRRHINKVVNHEPNHYTAYNYIWYSLEEGNSMSEDEKQKVFQIKPKIKNKSKQVICLNTGKVYPSIKAATEETKINNISKCCRHLAKSAGQINGEKAIGQYYDEYLTEREGKCQ